MNFVITRSELFDHLDAEMAGFTSDQRSAVKDHLLGALVEMIATRHPESMSAVRAAMLRACDFAEGRT